MSPTLVHLRAPMATPPRGLGAHGVAVAYEMPASASLSFGMSLETADAIAHKVLRLRQGRI